MEPSKSRTAAGILRPTVIISRGIANVEQQARIRLAGILVRHASVAEDSHLRSQDQLGAHIINIGLVDHYLHNTFGPERLLVLYQHPRQRCTDLRSQQSSPSSFIEAESSAWPQRNVHLAVVLVHQNFQDCGPGVRIFNVVEQKILKRRHISLRPSAELRILQEEDVGVLRERNQLAFDVLGRCFVTG